MNLDTGAYVAMVTAIVAAYLAYINQLRLKAFELYLARREEVLRDIERYLERLYSIMHELDSTKHKDALSKYQIEFHHEGSIIYQKIKGAGFVDPELEGLNSAFLSVIGEPFQETKDWDVRDWIERQTNLLSSLYGSAHREMSQELYVVAFSPVSRWWKKRRRDRRCGLENQEASKGHEARSRVRRLLRI